MDEATWLSSTHFQKLYSYLKTGQGTKGGRRKLRLLACACGRFLLWQLPVRDCDRKAVGAAEAFADGALGSEALQAAWTTGYSLAWPHDEGRGSARQGQQGAGQDDQYEERDLHQNLLSRCRRRCQSTSYRS
jgi:hypothetical protein